MPGNETSRDDQPLDGPPGSSKVPTEWHTHPCLQLLQSLNVPLMWGEERHPRLGEKQLHLFLPRRNSISSSSRPTYRIHVAYVEKLISVADAQTQCSPIYNAHS